VNKHPDEFTEDMIVGKNSKEGNVLKPYITAKFPHRDIPYTFHLGDGGTYEGYINKKLEKGKRYRIFVRAIVDTPRKVTHSLAYNHFHTI
jgi:receptor-type tyrosine-protein phosphatase F